MRQLEAQYSKVDGPLVAYNGALVVDASNRVVLDKPIDLESAAAVAALCADIGLHISLYCGTEWYANGNDHWTMREINNTRVSPNELLSLAYVESGGLSSGLPHKMMCMGEEALVDAVSLLVEADPQIVGYRSKPTYLEIAHSGVSKGDGLAWLASDAGVELDQIVFFGDNFNDLPAFEVAGFSVAVGNAKSDVLDSADFVTLTHHEDGVADFLNRWLDGDVDLACVRP